MKRWKKVVLAALVVLVVAAGSLALWQRKNVKVMYTALASDQETLAQDVQNAATEHREVLEDNGVTVVQPSAQQIESLLDGAVSADDVKETLGLLSLLKPDDETIQPALSNENESSPVPVLPSAEELLNQCVAELYALQINLMAELGEMKQAALDQWSALPAEERTVFKKQEIAMFGLRQCYDLEVQTDADVKELLARYQIQFSQIGADSSILDQLWTYYCEEKETQKAFYLNKYLK